MQCMNQMQEKACGNLAEIRHEIDAIDQHIVQLLGLRSKYIAQAAKFKVDEEGERGVRVPSRIKSMLAERCQQATEQQLDTCFIRHLFQQIIDHFVSCEMLIWNKRKTITSRKTVSTEIKA